LDHCDWLGNDVESIAREKAGIFRPNADAVFGSTLRPHNIDLEAQRLGTRLLRLGQEYSHMRSDESWIWHGVARQWSDLPHPGLIGSVQFDNAATVLAALECVHDRLPINHDQVAQGLRVAQLVGRFQILHRGNAKEWIVDVAHNPAAAQTLADNLDQRDMGLEPGRTIAVCGMMADKDVDGVIALLRDHVDIWIAAMAGGGTRALSAVALADKLRNTGATVLGEFNSIAEACEYADSIATQDDRVVAFGSFHTVGPALEWLQK
jgi:dihydrofolate synthase / folylpolyglutamate synthase